MGKIGSELWDWAFRFKGPEVAGHCGARTFI